MCVCACVHVLFTLEYVANAFSKIGFQHTPTGGSTLSLLKVFSALTWVALKVSQILAVSSVDSMLVFGVFLCFLENDNFNC